MEEILKQVVDALKIAGAATLAFGLLARVVSSSGRRSGKLSLWYCPSPRLCFTVHENRIIWLKKAKELVGRKLNATVDGFFLLPVWIGIIGLNVLLLAQVLDTVFPGGDRIRLPHVGTYTVVPLILGILYAISETVLAIISEDLKTKFSRVSVRGLVGLMLLGEAGLAWYRVWLINAGQVMISPTMIDNVMMQSGGPLAAGIAFCVGFAETLSGRFSFRDFVESFSRASLSWLGGLILWLWSGVTWWLFDFHRPPITKEVIETLGQMKIIPPWLPQLERAANNLEQQIKSLGVQVSELDKRHRSLPNAPDPADHIVHEVQQLKSGTDRTSVTVVKNGWRRQVDLFREEIAKVTSVQRLTLFAVRMKSFSKTIVQDVEKLAAAGAAVADTVQRSPRQHDQWQRTVQQFNDELVVANRKRQPLQNEVTQIEEDLRKGLDDLRKTETDAMSPLTTRLRTVQTRVSNVRGILADLEHMLESLTVIEIHEHPPNGIFAELTAEVLFFLKNDVRLLRDEGHVLFVELEQEYEAKKKELSKRDSFFRKLWNWLKRTFRTRDHRSGPPTSSTGSGKASIEDTERIESK
jgi:hypothetical protein